MDEDRKNNEGVWLEPVPRKPSHDVVRDEKGLSEEAEELTGGRLKPVLEGGREGVREEGREGRREGRGRETERGDDAALQ